MRDDKRITNERCLQRNEATNNFSYGGNAIEKVVDLLLHGREYGNESK